MVLLAHLEPQLILGHMAHIQLYPLLKIVTTEAHTVPLRFQIIIKIMAHNRFVFLITLFDEYLQELPEKAVIKEVLRHKEVRVLFESPDSFGCRTETPTYYLRMILASIELLHGIAINNVV